MGSGQRGRSPFWVTHYGGVAARPLGGEAKDGVESPEPGVAEHRPWCRANRHLPVKEQQQILTQKLRGHFAYYGITGNFRSLAWFRFEVVRCWRSG